MKAGKSKIKLAAWLSSLRALFLVHSQHLLTVSTQGNRCVRSLWDLSAVFPLCTEFPRQEYWSGLAFPSPGDLPNLGTEPVPPALQVGSLLSEPPGKPISFYIRMRNERVNSFRLRDFIALVRTTSISGTLKNHFRGN